MSNIAKTKHRLRDLTLAVDWATLGLFIACIGAWAGGVMFVAAWSGLAGVIVVALALVLHSSLSHEVLHGHPFAAQRASAALVIVSPGLFIPYLRFRDTHLAHHRDARLTDPYDDPESNYLDPRVWSGLPPLVRVVLRGNNTLAGRIVVGPALSWGVFAYRDARAIWAGDGAVRRAWVAHLPGVALVLGCVWASAMPVWLYLLACYAALSILKIRTFLEHQAHVKLRGRTAIIEDRGPLAFLFLNNNLHAVHHMHPTVPWYRLPALYRANRARYLACNDGYVYRSYGQVFTCFLFRAKDPVPHPLWAGDP